eukprot:TRINITY_DN66765_c0_g1_i1.p1 TRINITY_DN66765_c0_g1~~TRINITY_DN66765_c0_g1_i1.p1  ORF type:complete len:218 (-),score=18.37 TRINITY_DN66765_c0_g1_i1:125-682(-)
MFLRMRLPTSLTSISPRGFSKSYHSISDSLIFGCFFGCTMTQRRRVARQLPAGLLAMLCACAAALSFVQISCSHPRLYSRLELLAERRWRFDSGRDRGGERQKDVNFAAGRGEVVPGLWAWLKQMRLDHHWAAANAWCGEAGASTMNDVIRERAILVAALHLVDDEAETLCKRARTAYAAVNGFQ